MAPGEVAHKVGEEGENNIYVPNKHLPFTQTDQRQSWLGRGEAADRQISTVRRLLRMMDPFPAS